MTKNLKNKFDTYTIELDTAKSDGTVTCPKCNTAISPDDETENNYKIIDIKINKTQITKLSLICNKCNSTINLTGFYE
ncbi:MAG: hypothetical protein LBQ98_06910 [Nitrososphaerota archaeon]|jgi:hypothetical protein|nr:hypothetical protein [Nitrososphaerota archaeon]